MADWTSNARFHPNICINVGAEHTPIHVPQDSFNEKGTIAASDEFASTQRVERSSRQSVASTFPNTVEFGTTHPLRGTLAVTSLFSHFDWESHTTKESGV